jgi:hypothetical protein
MKLQKRGIFLVACLWFLTNTGIAQKVAEKPFQKWSKAEATKLLTDSPWVRTYQSSAGIAAASQEQIRREQADQRLYRDTYGGSSTRTSAPVPVVMRLHSGLPVRQAIVRLRQIQAGYDKMDETQRTEFDRTTAGMLNCAICQKFYVITMTRFLDSSKQSIEEGVFQRMGFEQLKGNMWLLNEKGERRELVQFNPPKNASDMTVLYFARLDDKGNPFLTAESKKFQFVFDGAFLNSANPYAAWLPRHLEFDVSKLIVGDKIEF